MHYDAIAGSSPLALTEIEILAGLFEMLLHEMLLRLLASNLSSSSVGEERVLDTLRPGQRLEVLASGASGVGSPAESALD